MPELEPIQPKPLPLIERVRGFCDCGVPLKRYCTIDGKTGKITENAVRCPRCRAWFARVTCFDVESLEPTTDPRTNKTVLPEAWKVTTP